MRKINILIAGLIACLCIGCQLTEEIRFNEDGTGNYSLGMNMSEMLKMGQGTKGLEQQMDTIIRFSDILEEKKDSIATLSKEEQEKLNTLKNYQVAVKMDTVSKEFTFKVDFDFKDIRELKDFAKNLKGMGVNELDRMIPTKEQGGNRDMDITAFTNSFETRFSTQAFERKITEKVYQKAMEKKKNDTTTSSVMANPFSKMITFKQIYRFPYKIKSVSNEKARVLPDFKGVELESSFGELDATPRVMDLKIEFDH
ncbi:hypothetical protein ACFSTE_09210 [Aquimarina hainanensis]|uniref:Lipoprotein n=1 Tax=Aquimarina hainanensis TaxID=1578017 RepID=A0ABW5NA00_9FLAO